MPVSRSGASVSLDDVGLTIDARGVSVEILREVDIRIAAGEFICLLGPSGSGKSTVLNLVAGLARPTSGTVLNGTEPVTGPGPDSGQWCFRTPRSFPGSP